MKIKNHKFDEAMMNIMRVGSVSVKITDDDLEFDIVDELERMNYKYNKTITSDITRQYKYVKITIVN